MAKTIVVAWLVTIPAAALLPLVSTGRVVFSSGSDAATQISPAIDARTTSRGIDVVETPERIVAIYGKPKRIRADQGTEFTSKDVDLWAWKNGVVTEFGRPGKPTDNAFVEAFNSRVRAELLNADWFLSLADARVEFEAWRRLQRATTAWLPRPESPDAASARPPSPQFG